MAGSRSHNAFMDAFSSSMDELHGSRSESSRSDAGSLSAEAELDGVRISGWITSLVFRSKSRTSLCGCLSCIVVGVSL